MSKFCITVSSHPQLVLVNQHPSKGFFTPVSEFVGLVIPHLTGKTPKILVDQMQILFLVPFDVLLIYISELLNVKGSGVS